MTKEDRFYLELGKRIRKARINQRLTQEQLADLVSLKRTSITNIEKGSQRILAHTLLELSEKLNISVNELIPPRPQKGEALKIENLLHKNNSPEEREFLRSVLTKIKKG
ncbi:MAG TPA: helix-turn-helix transcriptional regulator [Pyrinomonadaceae bacterium]|nr:helix-turn-helix transcriptional regulator [Pyrinomonadaceae bacterium]